MQLAESCQSEYFEISVSEKRKVNEVLEGICKAVLRHRTMNKLDLVSSPTNQQLK